MTSETNPPGPTKLETLLGGNKIILVFQDGKTEEVFVRQVPIKEYPDLLKLMDNEAALIECYVPTLKGRVDLLTLESYEKAIDEGERINQDFFSRWLARRLKRQEAVLPGLSAKLMDAAKGGPLADTVAECALRSHLTLRQARNHSLAQLRLLSANASRIQAIDAALLSHVIFAAAAASQHKDNKKILDKLRAELRKQADGE